MIMKASGRTLVLGEFVDQFLELRGGQYDTTPVRVVYRDGEEEDIVGVIPADGTGLLLELERNSDRELLERLTSFVETLADGPQTSVGKKAKALLEELNLG